MIILIISIIGVIVILTGSITAIIFFSKNRNDKLFEEEDMDGW